uniref:C2 domain-containing protein n=1 Tax=Toxocara canis TaxID=6265 RepID=A0A183TYB0_TOXCA
LFWYEPWFARCTIFWTYTWRTICRQLTLRALAQDNEEVCDERVLPSGVNFLAIHKALCEDFVHLELQNAKTALMCVLKIAVIVADDLFLYSKRMRIASDNFDSNKKMLAANSIEHICKFVKKSISRLLNIDALSTTLPQSESHQANSTFNQILSNAVEVGWLRAVLSRERSDQLLAYLDRFCSQIDAALFPRLSANAHHQLLQISERSILENLLEGQPPSYYRQIQFDCEMIRRVIQAESSPISSVLTDTLYLNASTTEQLILQYYAQLADRSDNFVTQMSTPTIRLRVGYIPTTNQHISVQIDVLSAANLPVLDGLTKSSDACCHIEVLPRFLFPLAQFRAQKTSTKKRTLNPIWDERFQLTMSEECFYTNGSVLCLSVVENELLAHNDLVGQAYVQLSRIPRLLSLCSKHRPGVIRLPLLLPSREQFNGAFQVLVERCTKDDLARKMCGHERYLMDYHMLPPCAENANTSALTRRRTFRNFMNTRLRRASTRLSHTTIYSV